MAELGTNMEESMGYGVSRRRVLQGAAWSVPAVMVAQMPAWAQTDGSPPPVLVALTGGACKLPGNATDVLKGNAFGLTISNTIGFKVEVEILSMDVNDIDRTIGLVQEYTPTVACSDDKRSYVLDDGDEVDIAVFTQDATSSPSTSLVVYYRWREFDTVDWTNESRRTSFVGSPWTGGCRPFGNDLEGPGQKGDVWDGTDNCETFAK